MTEGREEACVERARRTALASFYISGQAPFDLTPPHPTIFLPAAQTCKPQLK